jgi:hypothetical protein
LDAYIAGYPLPTEGERLINDIAFLHCEEPLISAQLWQSLTQTEQLALRLSLRHPNWQTETTAPRIVKLTPSDFVTKLTPAMLARLSPELDLAK